MSKEQTDFKKQWYSLNWKLAVLMVLLTTSPFIGYHFLIKEPVVIEKPVEVIKEIEVVKEGYGCAFMECFEYKSYSMWYQGPEGCCHQMQLRIKYKGKKQYYILENAAAKISKVYGKFYYSRHLENGVLIIQLDQYTNYDKSSWPKVNPKKLVPGNDKYIKKVYKAIDQSEEDLKQLFQ